MRISDWSSDVCSSDLYSRARYHVGDFLLRPVGRITCATLRLDLYRAALVGKIVTDRGTIALHAFVHAEQPPMTIEIDTSGDEDGCQWSWPPTPAVPTRPPAPPPPAPPRSRPPTAPPPPTH